MTVSLREARGAHPGDIESTWRAWLIGWLGGPVLAITNATVRELVYKERVGPGAAHVISTAALIALLGGYMTVLNRRWPLRTPRTAVAIGGAWLGLTVAFEFGFGHFVAGESWAKLLEQYDLRTGHVWIFVPIWTAIGPASIRALQDGNSATTAR